ncbi:hypothetical protein N7478_000757 [Penicillium angulare]|uniref:uncharacterized protein n=1 Tax=Penicillium angulare TaxID=116970 RepID=UPI00253FD47F|nr:uncharacterized protein N7478_000757 [Penicillium angulare]KAJ5291506.1 hypothetical protein N7478_000757 [Penicillium angulare]
MIIGVCSNSSIRDGVKEAAAPKINDDLKLVDLDLEPVARWVSDTGTKNDPPQSPIHVKDLPSTDSPPGSVPPVRMATPLRPSPVHANDSTSVSQMDRSQNRVLGNKNQNHEIFIRQRIAQGRM